MKRWCSAFAVAILVEATPASATELALDEVVRSVTTTFPLLRAAEKDKALAAADQLSAEGGFDPSLRVYGTAIPYGGYPSERLNVTVDQPTAIGGSRFFGGWRFGQGSFAPYDGKYETGDYGEARVGAQIPLWRDLPIDRRRAGLKKAEIGISVAKLSVEEQTLLVVRAASIRYWDWVAAGRKLAISRDLLQMATARDAQLALRVDRGDLPAYERAENLRVMHQREAQVVAAERSLQNAAIELSLYLRDPGGVALTPDPSRLPTALPPPEATRLPVAEQAQADALARRPEPRRLQALSRQAEVDLALAENQKKPAVDLFVLGAKDLGPAPPKIAPWELEVSLLVDIPILNRVQEGRRRAAEAQLGKLSEQARFAKERVSADVRDAVSALAMARERAAAIRREVDAARGLVESERERFALGESSLLVVNLREQAFAEAELREVDAIADHHRGVAALRAAVGGTGP